MISIWITRNTWHKCIWTISTGIQLCLHQMPILVCCGSDLTCVGRPMNSHVLTYSACDVTRLLKGQYTHRLTFAGNMVFCARAVPSASVQTVHNWVRLSTCLWLCTGLFKAIWSAKQYRFSANFIYCSRICCSGDLTYCMCCWPQMSRFQYSCLLDLLC